MVQITNSVLLPLPSLSLSLSASHAGVQVIQHVRSEIPLVEQRTESSEESFERCNCESTELRARIEETEKSDQGKPIDENTPRQYEADLIAVG